MVSTGDQAREPLRLEYIDPKTLSPNPANWRRHPAEQRAALSEVLGMVGWAGALLYNEATGRLVDGHARLELAGDEPVPVLIGSWTADEEAMIVVTFDPIGAMATADAERLASITPPLIGLAHDAGLEGLSSLLEGLAGASPAVRDLSAQLTRSYQVLIECTDETQQRALFDECEQRGLTCRLLIL